jgi:hypothetical protein
LDVRYVETKLWLIVCGGHVVEMAHEGIVH